MDSKSFDIKDDFDLKNLIKKLNDYKALFVIGATMYGFFYLYIYATKNGVPLPIGNSAFPAMILAVTAGVLILAILLFMIFLLPALITGNDFKVFYEESKPWYRKFACFMGLSGWTVGLAFAIPYFQAEFNDGHNPWIFWVVSILLYIVFTVWSCMHFKNQIQEKERRGFAIYLFSIQLLFLFLSLVLIGLLTVYLSTIDPSNPQARVLYWLGFLFAIVYYYYSSFPNEILLKNVTKKKILTSLIFVGLCIPINLPLFELSLRHFNIGGGYEATYYLNSSLDGQIPTELIDPADKRKTKKLAILMNLGKKKYVRILESKDPLHIYGLTIDDSVEVVVRRR